MVKKILALCMSLTLVFSIIPTATIASQSANTCSVEFYNESDDTKIDSIQNEQSIYSKVTFTAPKDCDAVIVTAKYNTDGTLQSAIPQKVENLTPGQETTYTTDAITLSDTDSVRVFVWDGLNNLVPAASSYGEIKKQPSLSGSASASVITAEGKTTAETVISSGTISAIVPKGTSVESGVDKLTLTVAELENSTGGINAGENEVLLPLDIHVEGIAKDNTVPVIITVEKVASVGLNRGNLTLYHVENGQTVQMTQVEALSELTKHNQFHYDALTGTITLAMATFSEVAVVADTVNAWNGVVAENFASGTGAEKDPYIIANADQLAYLGAEVSAGRGDAYYKLASNINMGGDSVTDDNGKLKFYPIGYNSEGYQGAFSGTFDGGGHTVSNIYQNTWQLLGTYDGTYYNDAMGLFGYVNGGTVKNLTVDNFSSDGEFTPTGVIAAYADGDANFENIAITNCNPRVYNTGNGGIIGVAGSTSAANDDHIALKNITVDNSNKISALWGSWDVACGGLVGMYRGNVDDSGNETGDTISFEKCHVAAQIDVYNDVCANYQYYAYRYAGMIIGSVRHNTKNTDGKTIPNMTGISATGCTVNYGDWNDYYYCEFEKNSLASYSEDYQFSRVDKSEIIFDESGNVTGCTHEHTDEEDKTAVYLPFHQLFTGYSWGVSSIGLEKYSGIVTNLDITEGDKEESVEKFETKFTGDFLYRVGNAQGSTVALGTLFAAKGDETINNSGVTVTIDKVDENTNVSGIYNPNTSDWTQGTIQFSGTGIVKVTIQDYNYCTPTVLYLEVVDAVNATSTVSATSNNVVLLKDVSGTFNVSNGYTFYGNGFKVVCSGNGSYSSKALSYGFVTVSEGGILDNVQVICDIFPESYLYTSEMTADSSGGSYPYAYSAVAITDNSTISNCYIYGARNNIFIGSGNVTIENTVTECGSLSNIQIKSSDANTVTLDNVTTIQYQTTSKYDTSKKVLGFGVVVGDNESASNPTIKLTGDLKQYNWVTSADTSVSNTYAKTAITEALKVEDYKHTINDTVNVNMGIAYLNAQTATITDERSNKETIPYKLNNITMSGQTGQVYSISGSNITADSRYDAETDEVIPYSSSKNRNVAPTVSFIGTTSEALRFESKYDNTEGRFISKLTVDLDNIDGGSYNFNFSDLKVQKYGVDLEFTVTDLSGNSVDKNTPLSLNQLLTAEYSLEATDNLIFDANGAKSDETENHNLPFVINATKTSIEPPKFANTETATAIRLVEKSGGDWRPAYTALTGVSVTYWSASESKEKTVDLSTLYNSGTISSNVWTYTCDDYTLTITGGAVHSDGSVITPVVANNTLYFASTNKAFGTGTTSRNIILTYVFADKNASTTWNRNETVTYSDLSEYDYNSFKNNGALTGPSSSSCITPETLITLADGSQKQVQYLEAGEELLVWNLKTGKYDTAPIVFNESDAKEEYEIVHLYFSDGSDVEVIYEHGFFDADIGEYVYIRKDNAKDYIGHKFVTQGNISNNTWKTAKLTNVVFEKKITTPYSPVTFEHLCYYTDGVLSMPGGIDGMFNIFEVDTAAMKYDSEKMASDIENYGLFTYDDFEEIIPEYAYEAFNGKYLKVAIGKGYITWNDILRLAERYGKYWN